MARPDGSFAFRIVWLVLIGAGTSFSDRLFHPELATTTFNSSVSGVTFGSSWQSILPNQPCHCCTKECNFQNGNLTCHQMLKFPSNYPPVCSQSVVNLNIVQGQFKILNDSGLLHAEFPALERLTIRNSLLEELDSLPVPEQLIEVNLSNNTALTYTDWMVFKQTNNLKILNLAYNQLESISYNIMTRVAPRLSRLDLSGNKWDCHNDFRWILKLHDQGILLHGDNLTCSVITLQKESWINWSYSVITQEITKRTVEDECKNRTANCSCQFVSEGKEGRISYTVQVDCSNRQLTSLPNELPNHTNELDVSGNYLTSLDQVNQYHRHPLRILIADSNQIQSIRNLSSSVFIRNFSRFSLRHNVITPNEIPLNDIVEDPSLFRVKYIYLYNNSWECDCNMATKVRDWLWKNRHVVNDSSLLLCSRDGRKLPVLQLLPNAVCESNHLYIDDATSASAVAEMNERKITILHSIIYLEVAAIAGLGLKLAYDSWHYIRHGQLPWIATKLF